MFRNFYWAWKVLRTRNLVLLTDDQAYCDIKYVDPKKFQDHLLVAAQEGTLLAIKEGLEELIEEHDRQSDEILGIKKPKAKPKAKSPKSA